MLLLFSAALHLIAFAGPVFSLQVFDRVLNARSETTLAFLLALVVFLLVLGAIVEAMRSQVLVRLGVRFDQAAAGTVFDRVVDVGLSAPRDLQHANALRDLDQVREGMASAPALAVLDAPFIPFYVAACFLFHPLIGWTIVGCGVGLALVALANAFLTQHPLTLAQQRSVQAASQVTAAHRSAEAVRALGMGASLRALWEQDRTAMLAWQAQASDRAGALTATGRLIRFLLPILATAAGGLLVIEGAITPGILIASSMLAARALLPLDALITSWRSLQGAWAAWGRLRALERASNARGAPTPLPRPSGQLNVTRLVVMPVGAALPALRGVSFSLAPGDVLGVVGSSGSGKSTLARVLLGALPPLAGEVRLAGATLDQWDPDALGHHLGYLPQDSLLFAGTVAQNIARFEREADPSAVIAAAMLADAHELILGLPQGYDTQLGDGGQGLSGGQRQRVALARALFGDPALVVLDEPNAALDGAGEAALMSALQTLRARGAIVVVMTHRTGVLAAATKLLVLEAGQMLAFGERDEVIAAMSAGPGAATALASKEAA